MTKILLATGNAHKAKELAALFAGHDIEVLTLRDVGFTGEIIEDGKTFEENAEIKARAAAELGYIGVGDDSGLCVDFLSGAPGIYSARYAGESCDYAKNNEKLLSEMAGVPEEKRNVAAAGCGPSCLCMMVDALTLSTYELTDCLKLSNEVGANREIGTSLKILGPVVAERFNLNYGETSDLNELKAHLAKGGLAIANSGGDREGYTGVFTHGGHYILVVSADDNEACILDPSYKEGKYEEPGRDGKARAVDGFVYCSLKVLAEDCANRTPSYYLFSRKH